jgi:tRNA pseudouridine38-40 synthase
VRRLRLVLEYDGTGFCGFQRQPSQPSVQEALEAKLSTVCGHPVTVVGAGRTDAGVHALGQVTHFDTTGRIPVGNVERAVNSLPGMELVVRQAEETFGEFHARFSAVRRTYQYYVLRERPSPFLARYVVHEAGLLPDAAERMRAALPPLVGMHDFAAFCAAGSSVHTTVRTLLGAEVRERGPLLRLELTADSFLHSMVRSIAGLLLEIGRGRREPEALRQALDGRKRTGAAPTAPPHGLYLARVDYPDGYPGDLTPSSRLWMGDWERLDEDVHGEGRGASAGLVGGGRHRQTAGPACRGSGEAAAREA